MSTKATWKVSAAVMASRVLGLVRDVLFAALFATRVMDAFFLAFKVPNLLRDLFAEGALSQAFVTTFSKKVKADGPQSAWGLANKMMTLTAVFMSAVSLIGILVAPWIVELLTVMARSGTTPREFDPDEVTLIVTMVRIMYPFILLVSLAALAMGMLNARGVFGMPALSSCFFNLGSILGGVGFGYWIDPNWGSRALLGLALGVVIGGLAQLVCQFPALAKVGYRFAADFRWKDSGVRQILRLMVPAVIAASVVQVNVVINSMFAYSLEEGSVSWLNYSFRLMQLPLGVFGVAVATVTLPALSRAAIGGISEDFRPTLAKGLRMVVFLVLPSTLGLMLLAEPIIGVIFERGEFTAFDRAQTAAALRAYGFGLLFYSGLKILQPSFYAIEKRWFPMLVSIGALFVNVALNYTFVFVLGWGHSALATTTSITATMNFMILYLVMRKLVGDLGTSQLLALLLKLLVAGGAMGGVCYLARHYLMMDPAALPFGLLVLWLSLTVATGAGVYFVAAKLLGVAEAEEALDMMMRKLRR
jgi:putative peptidoglycan lipid II flippase